MANIQLKDFTAKTSPVASDIVYVGNSADSFNEVKSTIGQLTLAFVTLNVRANNLISGYTTTATAGGTTVLTVDSTQQQYFTGVTTQTLILPLASTLLLGFQFTIVNNSTGIITVNSSGGNLVEDMQPQTQLVVTCILTSGTSAASWDTDYTADILPVVLAPLATQTITGGFDLVVDNGGSLQASSGNLTAGSSGFAGNLILFPPTAGKGILEVHASDSAAMYTGLLTNNSLSADRTWTMPDYSGTVALTTGPTAAVLLTPPGNQTITSGDLTLDGLGNFIATSGNISIGTGGGGWVLKVYPPTVGHGALIVSAANSAVNQFNFLTNLPTTAQRTWSLPDASGTIALVGGGSNWVDQTTATVTMVSNTGYTADAGASLITFTLPTTSAIGDYVEINGKAAGLWIIAQAAGQQIQISPDATTLGVGGSLASVNQYDCVRLRCVVANTIWVVVSQQSTGFTRV